MPELRHTLADKVARSIHSIQDTDIDCRCIAA